MKNRRNLLGKPVGSDVSGSLVGRDDPGAPHIKLSEYGRIVEENLKLIESYYECFVVDIYIIMPNHIHMIIISSKPPDGAPGSSRPTMVSTIIAAFKKFTAKEIRENIWQTSYYDRIIRDYDEYCEIWKYIDENPFKWAEDEYYRGAEHEETENRKP